MQIIADIVHIDPFIEHINSMVAKAHMRASQILYAVFLAAIHLF